MRHGRPILPPARAPLRRPLCAILALAALASPLAAQSLPATLRLTWDQPDHPSGIYHVKDEAALTILVDNPAAQPLELSGDLVFGSLVPPSNAAGEPDFKILSVTPIASAELPAGQLAKIPLKLAFGAAGSYELRWRHGDTTEPIAGSARPNTLECIFAPRTALAPATRSATAFAPAIAGDDSPWITLLPAAAVHHPGCLADYAAQTSVHRFLIDERFSFDPAKNVGLGFGASTGASVRDIDALLAEAAKAKATLTLRLTVPVTNPVTTGDRSLTAFAAYLTDAVKRGKGSLTALAIVPAADEQPITEARLRTYAAYYLAAYEAARKADKNIALLGAGSARLTAEWFADPKLGPYVDALAIADAVDEPAAARQFLDRGTAKKKPLLLLPPLPGQPWTPPAAALASGAAQVALPAPWADHGVTAHLLGGAVFVQRLQITVPTADRAAPESSNIPFIGVFQGDGYGIAAIAGFSAGTDLDNLYPGLARTRTQVAPAKPDDEPAYPNLQVGDDSRAMRVVDSAGAPVDCRIGDNVFIPAGDNMVYLLQGGAAADLAGSLRVATANHLPLFEPALRTTPEGLTLRLRNMTTHPLTGTVRLLRPGQAGDSETQVVAEKDFDAVPAGNTLTLPLEVTPEAARALTGQLVVEITTLGSRSVVQHTAISIPRDPPVGPQGF